MWVVGPIFRRSTTKDWVSGVLFCRDYMLIYLQNIERRNVMISRKAAVLNTICAILILFNVMVSYYYPGSIMAIALCVLIIANLVVCIKNDTDSTRRVVMIFTFISYIPMLFLHSFLFYRLY